ncbi:cytochrome P450 [Gigaspora margarita]|uniref:Cytochrome P450 n=1 Tax=Gigaspora margarita TaxID=4874 RepID=A0A8H4AMK6_GIGMA|nr:cytochrome P450 [Gigaspora margarita]
MHKIYGDIYEVYMCNERCIWICRGDLCEAIYNSPNKFLFRTTPNNGLDELNATLEGLSFNRNWELWKFNRKLVTKSLTSQKFLRDALEYIQVVWEEMEGYLKEYETLEDDDNGKILDFSKWISTWSTDMTLFLITNQNAFSLANYNSTISQNSLLLQNAPKSILKSPGAFIENTIAYLESWIFFAFTPKFVRMLPGFKERVKSFYDKGNSLRRDIKEIIQKRRKEIEIMDNNIVKEKDIERMKNQDSDDEYDDSQTGFCSDLLTTILTMNANRSINKDTEYNEDNVHSKYMTDDNITGLLIEVVGGGVETTPSTICYIIYYLAHYSSVRECLLKELDHTFGCNPNYKFEMEDLNKLKYCEAIINEEWRMSLAKLVTTFSQKILNFCLITKL